MYQDVVYVDIAVDIELLVFSWILRGLCCIIDIIHYIIYEILLLWSQPTSPPTEPSTQKRGCINTSDFSLETERASKEFLRCLEKKDDIGKSKLLNCVVESSSAADKPTVAHSLLTVTKRLLSKIQPAAILQTLLDSLLLQFISSH